MSELVDAPSTRSLRVAGLFAGIGGLELGLQRQGHDTHFLCELDPTAQAILRRHFPEVPIVGDIRQVERLPEVDLVVGGFPCQDLSLAGTQRGLAGSKSGLVTHMLRLIGDALPEFVVMENVLYLIKRDRGAQVAFLTDRLERLGYRWAYRVVDTRGFGLPQRRQRVVILASRGDFAPENLLFDQGVNPTVNDTIGSIDRDATYGFYWTEGKRAIGWARNSVPPIKGGSGLGIPSPPAVFDAGRRLIGTPSVVDGERLQGFPSGWTETTPSGMLTPGQRWTLIGNAVSVPVSEWLGRAFARPLICTGPEPVGVVDRARAMPWAVSGAPGHMWRHDVSPHVLVAEHAPLARFLTDPLRPLSERALRGFLKRVETGVMNMPAPFMSAIRAQIAAWADAA